MSKKKREFILVNTASQIDSVLRSYINLEELTVRGEKKKKAKVLKVLPENMLIIGLETAIETGGKIILSKIMARYLELHGKVHKQTSQTTKLVKIEKILIAANSRRFRRYPVKRTQAYITNYKLPKINLDYENSLRSTVVTVAFSVFQRKLKEIGNIARIELINYQNDFDLWISKEQKPLFVKDCSNHSSYDPPSYRFLDYKSFLRQDVQKKILSCKSKGIVSEIAMPIINIHKGKEPSVIGYMYTASKKDLFTKETVEEVRGLSFELMDYIRETNSNTIKEKQFLADLSVGGMSVRITSDELKEFLSDQSGFRFDLVIRNLEPVSIFAHLRSISDKGDGTAIIGLNIPRIFNQVEALRAFQEGLKLHVKRLAAEVF